MITELIHLYIKLDTYYFKYQSKLSISSQFLANKIFIELEINIIKPNVTSAIVYILGVRFHIQLFILGRNKIHINPSNINPTSRYS